MNKKLYEAKKNRSLKESSYLQKIVREECEADAKEIIANFEPKAIKFEEWEDGASVLIKDMNSDYSTWIDVSYPSKYTYGDFESDWNAYIFDLTTYKDVLEQTIQKDNNIFEMCEEEALDFLYENDAERIKKFEREYENIKNESVIKKNKKHSLKESANKDDIIWSSDAEDYMKNNWGKEDIIDNIMINNAWEDFHIMDLGTEPSDDEIERVLNNMDYDELLDYYDPDRFWAQDMSEDDLMENVYPMVKKQCASGYLFLNGKGANWQGEFDASLIKDIDDDNEFRNLFYPGYNAITELIDRDGILYFRESSHDVPTGWSMPLYSFKNEKSYENAIDYMDEELNKELDPEDRSEPDYNDAQYYFDELTNGDVTTFIEKGWLTPVKAQW